MELARSSSKKTIQSLEFLCCRPVLFYSAVQCTVQGSRESGKGRGCCYVSAGGGGGAGGGGEPLHHLTRFPPPYPRQTRSVLTRDIKPVISK